MNRAIRKGIMIAISTVGMFTICHMAEARKIRTKHSIPKKTENAISKEIDANLQSLSLAKDSIDFCDRIKPAIRFYGFDKTIGSNTESFFISNSLLSTLNGLEIQITYTDMKGRQLHKRTVRIETEIPPRETIRTDIKSWDTQKSFYFHKSVKPRRQATPFDVRIELISVNISDMAIPSASTK